jgi:hypothetical protein
MKTTITILIIIVCVVGCYQAVTDMSYSNNDVHYPHFAQQLEGDSLRIEYELSGDTLITHYIDLKVSGEDDTDESIDIKSILGIYKNAVDLQGPYHSFEEEGHVFNFNKKDLLHLCDSMIAHSEDSWTFKNIRDQVEPPVLQPPGNWRLLPISLLKHISNTDYQGIFHSTGGSFQRINDTYGSDLLKYLPCQFYKANTREMPEAIVVERFYYGRNYYIIYDRLSIIKIGQTNGVAM